MGPKLVVKIQVAFRVRESLRQNKLKTGKKKEAM